MKDAKINVKEGRGVREKIVWKKEELKVNIRR